MKFEQTLLFRRAGGGGVAVPVLRWIPLGLLLRRRREGSDTSVDFLLVSHGRTDLKMLDGAGAGPDFRCSPRGRRGRVEGVVEELRHATATVRRAGGDAGTTTTSRRARR